MVFFSLATVSIWKGQSQWISALMVLIYGTVLLGYMTWKGTSLTETLKDSPYYMGFLCTLVGILVGFKYARPDRLDLLLASLGSAITTSVVGLVMRYLLVVLDPMAEREDELVESLQEDLRENILRYRQAQIKLLEVVDEFSRSQTESIEIQKRSLKDLEGVLGEARTGLAGVLKDLNGTYDKTARELGRLLEDSSERYSQWVGRLNAANAGLDVARVAEGMERLDRATRDVVQIMEGSTSSAGEIREILDKTRTSLRTTGEDLDEIDKLLTEFVQIATRHIRSLRDIGATNSGPGSVS